MIPLAVPEPVPRSPRHPGRRRAPAGIPPAASRPPAFGSPAAATTARRLEFELWSVQWWETHSAKCCAPHRNRCTLGPELAPWLSTSSNEMTGSLAQQWRTAPPPSPPIGLPSSAACLTWRPVGYLMWAVLPAGLRWPFRDAIHRSQHWTSRRERWQFRASAGFATSELDERGQTMLPASPGTTRSYSWARTLAARQPSAALKFLAQLAAIARPGARESSGMAATPRHHRRPCAGQVPATEHPTWADGDGNTGNPGSLPRSGQPFVRCTCWRAPA